MTSEFAKQFNYYLNLYESVPEEFDNFGHFGIETWHHMVNEGLINTYPKKTLIKFLEEFGLDVEPFKYSQRDDYQHDITKIINTTISKKLIKNIKEYSKELVESLFLYGYSIANIIEDDENNLWKIIIEPKFPSEITTNNLNVPFYHITYRQYMSKIDKIGLNPRDSRTIFSHPGGRVYLIQTKDVNNINSLKFLLANSRYENTKKKYPNYPKDQLEEIKSENMVVLKIDVSGLKLYEDPMFPSKKGTFNACFTTQNIHPSKINNTNY